jgi:4-hydroxy-3-polyprenylbenzoate decarboxylase
MPPTRQKSHIEKNSPGPRSIFKNICAGSRPHGLLTRIDRAIDKDRELHPLVRCQFQGGLAEEQRRAFLFTNVWTVPDGAMRP